MPAENVGGGGTKTMTITGTGNTVKLDDGTKVEFSPQDCSFELTHESGDRVSLTGFYNLIQAMADIEPNLDRWLGDAGGYGKGEKQ
jgi:hypothetical protein